MLRKIQEYINNFHLRKQITALLSFVFVGGILVCGLALAIILNQNAQAQIIAEAEVAFKTIMAVRSYTNLNPSNMRDKAVEIFIYADFGFGR